MPNRFSVVQIALHWTVALLIPLQFLDKDAIGKAARTIARGGQPDTTTLVTVHVYVGIAILALVLWRLALRARRGTPPPPSSEPAPLRRISVGAHWVLYLLLVLIPVSGLAAWFGGLRLAGDAHELMTTIILYVGRPARGGRPLPALHPQNRPVAPDAGGQKLGAEQEPARSGHDCASGRVGRKAAANFNESESVSFQRDNGISRALAPGARPLRGPTLRSMRSRWTPSTSAFSSSISAARSPS